MPSIIDQIAEELKTSKASVSRALNNKPGVGKALRAQILERAQELDYVPTLTARAFSESKTFAIGFFVAEKAGISVFNDPFYGEILHGAEKALARTDYHLIVATLTGENYAQPDKFRFVREKRIDGMILAGPDVPRPFVRAMNATGLPVILIDNLLENSTTHSINADDFNGGRLAADYLLAQGHRDMTIIAGPEQFASGRLRIAGFQSVLAEHGLPPAPVLRHPDHTTVQCGEELFAHFVQQPGCTTALFAVTDSLAIGAIRAARAHGVRVPEDVSIIGFDDTYLAQIVDPALTTIRIPKLELGGEAVTRLVSLLHNPDAAPTRLALEVTLVARESVRRIDDGE